LTGLSWRPGGAPLGGETTLAVSNVGTLVRVIAGPTFLNARWLAHMSVLGRPRRVNRKSSPSVRLLGVTAGESRASSRLRFPGVQAPVLHQTRIEGRDPLSRAERDCFSPQA
jgi:hypothetical protein